MSGMEGFSDPIELPDIPAGPGLALIVNSQGKVLQITMANNIRRRIGALLDSDGQIAVHGPKIYKAQQDGVSIFVRWKLTTDYRAEKARLMEELRPEWAPKI